MAVREKEVGPSVVVVIEELGGPGDIGSCACGYAKRTAQLCIELTRIAPIDALRLCLIRSHRKVGDTVAVIVSPVSAHAGLRQTVSAESRAAVGPDLVVALSAGDEEVAG